MALSMAMYTPTHKEYKPALMHEQAIEYVALKEHNLLACFDIFQLKFTEGMLVEGLEIMKMTCPHDMDIDNFWCTLIRQIGEMIGFKYFETYLSKMEKTKLKEFHEEVAYYKTTKDYKMKLSKRLKQNEKAKQDKPRLKKQIELIEIKKNNCSVCQKTASV